MALIKCTECDKEFSDRAEACPNCGCPTEYNIIQEQNNLSLNNSVNLSDRGNVVESTIRENEKYLKKPKDKSKVVIMIIAAIFIGIISSYIYGNIKAIDLAKWNSIANIEEYVKEQGASQIYGWETKFYSASGAVNDASRKFN